MQKKNNIWLIVGVTFVVVSLLVWLFWYLMPSDRFNWYETYKVDDKEPYGAYVISEMMKGYHPNDKFTLETEKPVHETLGKKDHLKKTNYVFVGEGLFFDSADVQTLLSFVNTGNNVFISSQELPRELTINIPDFQCYWKGYRFRTDSTVKMNFSHPDLHEAKPIAYSFMHKDEVIPYYWAYFNTDHLCGYKNTFARLGYFETKDDSEHVNFVKIPYGNGCFYFHTTPIVFTNFFMIQERPLMYADKVFSHLGDGDIYWDEFSKIPHYMGNHDGQMGRGDSPLQFLLQQKSMRWAWFTLLFGVVLTYIVFRAKRRQRIIPLLEPNTNTSMEFVQTIGRLYFLQNNHRGLSRQMMRYFLSFVRNKYSISTAKINDDLVRILAQRSKVEERAVKNIFTNYNLIDKTASEIPDQELIHFHQSLEYFYKNCK